MQPKANKQMRNVVQNKICLAPVLRVLLQAKIISK